MRTSGLKTAENEPKLGEAEWKLLVEVASHCGGRGCPLLSERDAEMDELADICEKQGVLGVIKSENQSLLIVTDEGWDLLDAHPGILDLAR